MRLPATILFVTALTACGGADAPATPEPTVTPAKTAVTIEVDPEVMHKADLADGNEDHVVGQCGSCALGMEGTAEHAVQVGDYEMPFCSQSCATRMETEPEEVMETVKKAVRDS
jgi:hypothetical protein